MCLHYSNAPELALQICNSEKPHMSGPTSPMEQRLDQLLDLEQERMVQEYCNIFAHGSKLRGKMCIGTLREVLF